MADLLRLLRCALGMCPFYPNWDDTGAWGECRQCGKRVGFVTREQLRAYADAEYARESTLRALAEGEGKA